EVAKAGRKGQLGINAVVFVIIGVIGAVIIQQIITDSLGNFTGVNNTLVSYVVTLFLLGLFGAIAYMSGLMGGGR
ncbi:hypothetical protein DRQ25_14065, partial [Candidatus Fermentibacteria bacterium]